MQYNLNDAIAVLERTPKTLKTLLQGLPDSWIYNNEGKDTWNVYDVIGHYIHLDKADWISRIETCLSNSPDKTFKKVDRTAMFEESKGKTFDQLLDEFIKTRNDCLQQLRSMNLDEKALDSTANHTLLGEVTLRQLLSSWVVHDLTHIYQIARVMAVQYETEVGPWKQFMGILTDRSLKTTQN